MLPVLIGCYSYSDLTIFNSPPGRFQYDCLKFCLIYTQDILQQRLEQALSCILCSIIANVIVVGGKTENEHEERLERILQRA